MKLGGKNQINRRTAQIIRFSGLATPIFLLFYGFLASSGMVNDSHYINFYIFSGLMVPWLTLAVYQFLFDSRSTLESVIRLCLYHILAVGYLLTVSGFAMPFLVIWVILTLSTYVYLGLVAAKVSIIAFILAISFDVLLHVDDYMIAMTNLLAMVAILFVSIVILTMSGSQNVEASELTRSRKQESLQRDRILTIVNNLADAVLSTNEDGVITVFNAASLNLLDTNTRLDGQKIDDVLKLRDEHDKPFGLMKQLASSRSVVVRDDLTLKVAKDESLRLEVTYSPIRSSYNSETGSEKHDGYIIIMRDITRAKSLEEERDEFISVVSHELRTPITIAEGLISNLQLMLARGIASPTKVEEGIAGAHDQVMFLSRMVNDLSTLSRAERGVADAAELIDVRDLVNGMFSEYSPQADEKQLKFNLDVDTKLGHVMASRLYLEELLQNFITNAIKYTAKGSITLEVRRKKDVVLFAVRDTGIGISKADQAKVFDKFFRAEDYRTRETNGTGLGLYVAGKLARKLETEVKLTSRLNHGSSFSFTLPIADDTDK